jgi:hypothetical protein
MEDQAPLFPQKTLSFTSDRPTVVNIWTTDDKRFEITRILENIVQVDIEDRLGSAVLLRITFNPLYPYEEVNKYLEHLLLNED